MCCCGAVLLTDEGRRSFIKAWQDKKREELKHPYLGEKLKWGLGQRVQNSVFECMLDPAQCRMLKARLCAIMNKEKDSLRLYYLGNNFENKIEHFGAKSSYLPKDTFIL